MAPSPGSAALPSPSPPAVIPPHRSSPRRPSQSYARASSSASSSTSDGGDTLDEDEDDELVFHAGQPSTWIQQQAAGVADSGGGGGRRQGSFSLAERPHANPRSSSDWRSAAAHHAAAGEVGGSTASTSEDGGQGAEEGRDELSGLPGPSRTRSRTSSSARRAPGARTFPGEQLHPHFVDESPFSRPGSAVTSPYAPSRPASAARPSSAATQRRFTGLRSGWGFPQAGEGADAYEEELETRDVKGKGRARDPPAEPEPAAFDPPPPPRHDPLDPLYALQQSPSYAALPPSSPLTPQKFPSRASSLHSAGRAGAGIVRPRGPPPPALRPPDPFAHAGAPHPSAPALVAAQNGALRFPTSHASSESLASSAASSPSASSSNARQHAHQPSLQQLLQTVDLGAALKLVQTLQAQQSQAARVAATVGTGTASNTAVPAAGAAVEPISPARAGAAAGGIAHSGTVIDFGAAAAAVPPPSPAPVPPGSPAFPSFSNGAGGEPPSPVKDGADKPAAPPRRLSLMGGLQKRLRTGSAASRTSGDGAEEGAAQPALPTPPRVRERERERERREEEEKGIEEAARAFEEQISRVHLALSPATLRRAQNCARYLSLRYTPLFAALSAPDRALAPPSPLAVARWRVERDEAEKRSRRQQADRSVGARFRHARAGSRAALLGASPPPDEDAAEATRLSTLGGVRPGAKPSPYGPRRNKAPGVWEVYPDDIADYVALGGKTTLAEAAQARGGGSTGGASTGVGEAHVPMPVREHKRGSMSIDQLFRTSTSSTGRSTSAGRAQRLAAEQEEEDNLSRIPTGASSSISTDGRAQPYLQNGLASSRSLPRSDGRASPVSRPASPASPQRRPGQVRQTSYEGAPFSRSKHSFHGSDGVYAASPLRRSTSLSASASGQPRSPVQGVGAGANGSRESGAALLYSDGSPQSRIGSARASRDDLPSLVGTGGAASSSTSRHRHTGSTAEALRTGISRRLDRIRGRTMDDASAPEGLDTPVLGASDSDYALRSPARRGQAPLPLPQASTGSSGHASSAARRHVRPYLRKNNTSVDLNRVSGFDSDGFVRSSGDEALIGGAPASGMWRRASRGILQSAWQGFKTSLDAYPDPWAYPPRANGLHGGGGPGALRMSGMDDDALGRGRIVEANEDDESEDELLRRRRQPREVVDLGEEDFARLTGTLRQLRTSVAHLDDVLPQRIVSLSTYLDELSAHAEATTAEARIATTYSAPRLPASVLADIAHTKRRYLDEQDDERSGTETDTESESSSSVSSSSSSSSSSRISHVSSLAAEIGNGYLSPASSRRKRSLRVRQPRRQNSDRMVQAHARHVTDPVAARQQTRMRSQTLALPPSSLHPHSALVPRARAGDSRASGFSPVQHAEPLRVLDNVLRDLTRAADELEEGAQSVAKEQDDVDGRIAALVGRVEATQKSIEDSHYPALRNLEDNYLRLKTHLARPSPLAALLSTPGAIAARVLFWVVRLAFVAASPFRWLLYVVRMLPSYLDITVALLGTLILIAAYWYGICWLPDLSRAFVVPFFRYLLTLCSS
ncbi:hypothetical protein JCM10450v2_003024 [Rhodotorula kratochvilovae]